MDVEKKGRFEMCFVPYKLIVGESSCILQESAFSNKYQPLFLETRINTQESVAIRN